jgi:hypothetical protein
MLPGLIVTKTDNKNYFNLLYITDINNKNYTLHPQSAFMRFVSISEHTAIISLYNIH